MPLSTYQGPSPFFTLNLHFDSKLRGDDIRGIRDEEILVSSLKRMLGDNLLVLRAK